MKFIDGVEHRTFSGIDAAARGQPVLYVTERCVFRLCEQGLELIEVAPGIDVQNDILRHMAFRPVIRHTPKLMDPRIFRDEPMQLRHALLDRPMNERLVYDAVNNVFYIDLAGLSIHGLEDIEHLREAVERAMAPVGRKVYAIVNYDRLSIRPDLVDEYVAMVKVLMHRHYLRVTRYTSSTFLRMKLGEALARDQTTPHHFYRSENEARGMLGH